MWISTIMDGLKCNAQEKRPRVCDNLLENVNFLQNSPTTSFSSSDGSGGIHLVGNNVTCINCVFQDNVAYTGGAVYSQAILNIISSKFVRNFGVISGGVNFHNVISLMFCFLTTHMHCILQIKLVYHVWDVH